MPTTRYAAKHARSAPMWWQPVVYSAVAAAIATLFTPVPALADPAVPQGPLAPAVPDVGSRPMALGTLVLPGQQQAAASPVPTPTASLSGVAASPVLQKIEKGRALIATLGDQLIQLGQDRDLARTQQQTAERKYDEAELRLRDAQTAASAAAAAAMREAAAMPPGALDPGLSGLDDLARLQRGDGGTQQAAARQLEVAQIDAQIALDAEKTSDQHYTELAAKYTKLNATLVKKQAAQQKLELDHADELRIAENAESAQDSRLGAEYLGGAEAGRGADPRAIQALEIALSHRGDPYVWSEEGPHQFDCSGLMYLAYRTVGFPLTRVSRDQYWQTRDKAVDRYSLLPGDLLFFSYSNSWRGIHHVAMYAGDGKMIEAPRTGLNVRLVPVRWSRLFGATRVFGSVPGIVHGPDLGAPDPEPTNETPPSSRPTTSPTPRPTTPRPTPSKSTTPSPSQSSSPTPSTSPTRSTNPTSNPTSSSPTSSAPTNPAPTSNPTTSAPTGQSSSPATGASSASGDTTSGGSPSGGASSGAAASGTGSTTAAESATATASKTSQDAPGSSAATGSN